MTFTRAQQSNRKPKAKKPLKRGKPLKRQSVAKGEAMADRRRVRKMLIKQRGDICELRFHPQCRNKAQGLHEPLKQSAKKWRVGDYERGRVVWLACDVCNCHVEDEPLKAKSAGLTESRYNNGN